MRKKKQSSGSDAPTSNTDGAITTRSTTALTTSNSRVLLTARRLNWKPETVIARIERALPAVVEQQVYLRVGPSFGVHPESVAKILRYHLGDQELQVHDLSNRSLGRNLVSSRFTNAMEFLRETLNLLGRRSIYSSMSISIENAARLVSAYGDDAPAIIESVVDNLGLIRDRLKIRGMGNDRLASFVVTFIAKRVDQKVPVMDVMEIFELDDTSREFLGMLESETGDV